MALSLSTFALAAAPEIKVPNADTPATDKSSTLGIKWTETPAGSGIYKPQTTNDQDFKNLTFEYSDALGDLGRGSLTDETFTATIKNAAGAGTSIITNLTATGSTIKLGKTTMQGGKEVFEEGTLTVDFKDTTKSQFNLIAEGAANQDYAFIGNIVTTRGSQTSGQESYFSATFKKSVQGNITLNNGGTVIPASSSNGNQEDKSKALIFDNNAGLEGDLTVGGQNADILFQKGNQTTGNASITGKVSKTAGINLNLNFEGGGKIGSKTGETLTGGIELTNAGVKGETTVNFKGGESSEITTITQSVEAGQNVDARGTVTVNANSVRNKIGTVETKRGGTNKINFGAENSTNAITLGKL